NLRNHIEQLATRIGEIVILRVEKLVSFFQLVVLVNGIEVNRTHVVELRAKIRDDFLKINVAEVDRVLRTRWQIRRGFAAICSIARRAVDPPFRLRAQNFLERGLIDYKRAKINLVAARNMLGEIVDLHLQLRLAHLSLSASILQFAQ